MYRVSNYTISIPLTEDKDRFMLVHGYSGAFDIVNESIHQALRSSATEEELLCEITAGDRQVLEQRGYLTTKTEEEERQTLGRISEALHRASSKVISVTLIPTYNCNFRCEYCFEKKLFDKGKDYLQRSMDAETLAAVFIQIDKYREEGYQIGQVTLFGGEPLLRTSYPIVKQIVDLCKERGITLFAVTNGHDLKHYQDLLTKDGINSIQITLDGEEATHDSRRYLAGGQPTFARIVENITMALKQGIHVAVRSNVNKRNIAQLEGLMQIYQDKGWTEYPNFSYYFKSTHKCYEEPAEAITDVELMERLNSIYGGVEGFSFNSIYSNLTRTLGSMFKSEGYAPLRAGYCGATTGMFTIDPYGDIYPCWDVLGDRKESIGVVNLEQSRFELNERSAFWRGRTADKIEECAACQYALFCGGGCGAHANITNKDHYTAYCENFKLIFDEVVAGLYSKILKEPAQV